MSFSTTNPGSGPRHGTIDKLGTSSVTDVETPCLMLYTKTGNVPYLTKDVLERIENLPKIAMFPLGHFLPAKRHMQKYEKGLKKYADMEEFAAVCTVSDPTYDSGDGFEKKEYKNRASISTYAGFESVFPKDFSEMIHWLKPDMLQILTQTTVPQTRKKMETTLVKNRILEEDCQAQAKKADTGDHPSFIGTALGGDFMPMKTTYNRQLLRFNYSAYIIEGFHKYGSGTEFLDPGVIMSTLNSVTSLLPTDSFRILPGVLNPSMMLHAVGAGVDMFDTSYCYVLASRHCALTFDYSGDETTKSFDIPGSNGIYTNLKHKSFENDMTPLVPGCTCYTCRTYTRSYLSHLANTKEMLCHILLMIHNLHHYLRFFEAIRRNLAEGKFEEFAATIHKQCTYAKPLETNNAEVEGKKQLATAASV